MGKVKSAYEKALDEFYQIEEAGDLKEELGTEFNHIENHFAARNRLQNISETLLEEYEEAYKTLSKDKIIELFNTKEPSKKFFFKTDAEVFSFVKEKENPKYIQQMKDPAENRTIINYGNKNYFYVYKIVSI